jgi:type IV pilus assembly protein PilA
MTLVELCIVIVVLGILLVTAVAGFARARVSSNEASAIASLRAIYSAQFSFAAGCGQGGYATTLVSLTQAPPGGREGYLSPDLGGSNSPTRNGYRFALRPGLGGLSSTLDCRNVPTQTRYYASTTPVTPGNTGNRSFAMTQAGAVWQINGPLAPSEPFGPPAELASQ